MPAHSAVPRTGAKRKPRDERSSELLSVATQVIYEHGYEAATLQEIADRLGMMKASLYYYFDSKETLFIEVLRQAHDTGLAVVRRAANEPGDPLQRLESVIRQHVEHTCNNLVAAAVCQEGILRLPEEIRRDIVGSDHVYQEVFRSLIVEAQSAGLVRPGANPRLATLSILGATNTVYRWFVPHTPDDARLVAVELADLAIRSVATPEVLLRRDPLTSKEIGTC